MISYGINNIWDYFINVVEMELDKLFTLLRSRYGKILKEKQNGFYSIILYNYCKEPKYIICVKTRRDLIFGKICKFDSISSLSCYDLLYEPSGLYIFSKTIEEFLEKLDKKMRLLKWRNIKPL